MVAEIDREGCWRGCGWQILGRLQNHLGPQSHVGLVKARVAGPGPEVWMGQTLGFPAGSRVVLLPEQGALLGAVPRSLVCRAKN